MKWLKNIFSNGKANVPPYEPYVLTLKRAGWEFDKLSLNYNRWMHGLQPLEGGEHDRDWRGLWADSMWGIFRDSEGGANSLTSITIPPPV